MRASNAEEIGSHGSDPWDVFTQLVILIVEGRTPGGERGYHAGPHCFLPQQPIGNKHSCDTTAPVCARAESLVKQLKLMWGVGVGVSVEVLLAPDCEHGAAITTAPDTTSAPSPYLRLIEQWNFSVFDRKLPEATSSGWSLVAAVRSFLHFSQLSAWLSVSRGSQPPNVLYRLTVTSPVFSSKFDADPEEHTFPLANIGQDTSIKVIVKTLPRINQVPVLFCPQHGPKLNVPECQATTLPSVLVSLSDSQSDSSEDSVKNETNRSDDDLRRIMMKAKLSDASRVSRSESPDTQLGDSLLDPPNSLSRIPRRFQSPSRSGSPSLETPENLICKVRQPGPSHARPPDVNAFYHPLIVPARQPSNLFPWTRTRYPNLEHSYSLFSLVQPPPKIFQTTAGSHAGVGQMRNASTPLTPPRQYSACDNSKSLISHQWNSPSLAQSDAPQYIWPHHHGSSQNATTAAASPFAAVQRDSSLQQNRQKLFHECGFLPTKPSTAESFSPLRVNILQATSASQAAAPPSPSTSNGCATPLTSPPGDSTTSCCSYGGRSQENQGTKRKGAYTKESPRTKRESPPHSAPLRDDEGDSEEDSPGNNLVNDQLWPSCSQPGKHLCSSVDEDLNEICKKSDGKSFSPFTKSMKNEASTPGSSKLKPLSGKIKFDLTPKETREILCVLRQNAPVPPLRMDQHIRNPAHQVQIERSISKTPTGKRATSEEHTPWHKDKVKEINVSKALKRESLEHVPVLEDQSSRTPYERWYRKRASTDDDPNAADSSSTSSSSSSSNAFCDNNFKRTHNTSKARENCLAPRNEDFEDVIEDGLSSMEIECLRPLSSPSTCILAKKITQKTNFFTANSQPTSSFKEIPKQVSQTLAKSPFSSVLSSIQSVSIQGEKLPDHGDTKVKRALTFQQSQLNSEKCPKAQILSTEISSSTAATSNGTHSSNTASVTDAKLHCLKDTKEGFVKGVNLYKNLLKSSPAAFEDNIAVHETNERWKNEITFANGCDTIYKDISCSLASLAKNENTLSEEDREVEDLCRARGMPIPTASDKVNFRRSLDSAATLVFHNKTGLPLTSSPAPMRRGKRFDYDSSLNSVAAIRSALRTCENEEDEEAIEITIRESSYLEKTRRHYISSSAPATVTCSNLLGSFEECVLNGRLEPVSTVQGFVAEIAASGVFCPKHITKPVTVFFYTLCDNDQISSPYMGHINLGKKGYHIPSQGTVQITLFNPHGTVVKMFVVVYDLSDMPPNSKTFLRQRTLNMPVDASDTHVDAHQWLRYLIHLRFASSKSGKIYLHTDIRLLIFRKSDADAATLHKTSVPYELRSFTNGPSNPKFSPRK